jgi:hypothetical protein
VALHAWDWPAETALALAAEQRVELVLPRLGAPVEPARGLAPEPWWRASAGAPVSDGDAAAADAATAAAP